MEEYKYFNYLLTKYQNDTLTENERQSFYDLINTNQFDDFLSDKISSSLKANAAKGQIDLNPQESKFLLDHILDHQNKVNNGNLVKEWKTWCIRIGGVAATLIIVFFVWFSIKKDHNLLSPSTLEFTNHEYLELFNDSDTIKELILSDLSSIEVYPKATIRYPATFTGADRTVFLTGKAFFTVSSDSLHPFIVYSGNLKTSVLGTSFLVNSDQSNGVDEVEVSTGRVRVMENRLDDDKNQSVAKSLILTANQKGVYKHKARVLHKTLVRVPLPLPILKGKLVKTSDVAIFDYDQAMLSKVVNDLQSSYGVHIVMEEEGLGDCTFTGNLTDIDLFKKLKIICLTTGSTYKVVGADIIIKGKGCKKTR